MNFSREFGYSSDGALLQRFVLLLVVNQKNLRKRANRHPEIIAFDIRPRLRVKLNFWRYIF